MSQKTNLNNLTNVQFVHKFLSAAGAFENKTELFLTSSNYMIIWRSEQFYEKSVNDKVQWF